MPEEAQAAQEESGEARKKSPLLTVALVAALMIAEAIGAVAFIKLSGGPSDAAASELEGAELAEAERTTEIPIWTDQRQMFQNLASGRAWSWQIDVVLQVKQKNVEFVTLELERRKAEITEGIALIVRQAAHSHLTEPGLETLHRQLSALIERVFGLDAEGAPRIERVIVPKLQGVPSE